MTDNPLSLPSLLTGQPDPCISEFMVAAREQGMVITFELRICPSEDAVETPNAQ